MRWASIGAEVQRVRALQHQTQADFAAEIGLSVRVVGAIESGIERQYDAVTIHRVEAALGWETGSVDHVLCGGAPVIRHDAQLARIVAAWPRLKPQARAMLAGMAGEALRG